MKITKEQEQNYTRQAEEWVNADSFFSGKKHWSDVCREVLENGPQKYNGMLVDAFTASGVVQVIDGLSEETREKFLACDFQKAVSIMWKMCR